MKLALHVIMCLFVSLVWAQQPIGKTQQTIKESAPALKCVSGNCEDGWGRWEFDNGYYDGFWMNGKREGYGVYDWNASGTYNGFWLNDKMDGYGSYENKEGNIFTGMFTDNMLNGLGEESNYNKDEFKRGFYKNNQLQTPYVFVSNGIDSGCTAGNCKDSYGNYVWENGDVFTGYFKNNVAFLGRYEFKNGDVYQGMFNLNGQFHGQGRFFYAVGGYYGGNFYNGEFSGKGYYHDKDNKTRIGVWDNGTLLKTL